MAATLADAILARLGSSCGEPVSGQDLAGELGVTRAAVWKAIKALREEGYEVESFPARGYVLKGGRKGLRPGEVAPRLKGLGLGAPYKHLAATGSTNRVAAEWARDGVEEGALVIAEHQEEGRGRLGRQWLDRPGETLLMSLVLRPRVPVVRAPLITLVAAVALAEALQQWIEPGFLEIKWPNDLLVSSKKVAGILLEMASEGQSVAYVIMGLGVNVGGGCEWLPDEVARRSSTLESAAGSAGPDRLDVLEGFLRSFEELYGVYLGGDFEGISRRWNEWFKMRGRKISVVTPNGRITGKALGLTEDGALELEPEGKERIRIYAGDVEW